MFLVHKPSEARVQQFLASQRERPFSYPAVGATRTIIPRGYVVDHHRVRLGSGADAWSRARAALRRWEMFHLGWARIYWPDAPIAPGSTVAILAVLARVWSLNAARIVYVVAEGGAVERSGFAYGTLPAHVERGEERFVVEWQHADDSVWYDLLAFSRPQHPLVAAGYPVARALQRRFARDSQRAMLRAVTGDQ